MLLSDPLRLCLKICDRCTKACVDLQGSMTLELFRFQKLDLAWMQSRERLDPIRCVSGGIYANAPGLGKTVTVIALILAHIHHHQQQVS